LRCDDRLPEASEFQCTLTAGYADKVNLKEHVLLRKEEMVQLFLNRPDCICSSDLKEEKIRGATFIYFESFG